MSHVNNRLKRKHQMEINNDVTELLDIIISSNENKFIFNDDIDTGVLEKLSESVNISYSKQTYRLFLTKTIITKN